MLHLYEFVAHRVISAVLHDFVQMLSKWFRKAYPSLIPP
jgi:hypothetical protein